MVEKYFKKLMLYLSLMILSWSVFGEGAATPGSTRPLVGFGYSYSPMAGDHWRNGYYELLPAFHHEQPWRFEQNQLAFGLGDLVTIWAPENGINDDLYGLMSEGLVDVVNWGILKACLDSNGGSLDKDFVECVANTQDSNGKYWGRKLVKINRDFESRRAGHVKFLAMERTQYLAPIEVNGCDSDCPALREAHGYFMAYVFSHKQDPNKLNEDPFDPDNWILADLQYVSPWIEFNGLNSSGDQNNFIAIAKGVRRGAGNAKIVLSPHDANIPDDFSVNMKQIADLYNMNTNPNAGQSFIPGFDVIAPSHYPGSWGYWPSSDENQNTDSIKTVVTDDISHPYWLYYSCVIAALPGQVHLGLSETGWASEYLGFNEDNGKRKKAEIEQVVYFHSLVSDVSPVAKYAGNTVHYKCPKKYPDEVIDIVYKPEQIGDAEMKFINFVSPRNWMVNGKGLDGLPGAQGLAAFIDMYPVSSKYFGGRARSMARIMDASRQLEFVGHPKNDYDNDQVSSFVQLSGNHTAVGYMHHGTEYSFDYGNTNLEYDPDQSDNCPFHSNVNQEDCDKDGVGDVCDNCNPPQSSPCNDDSPYANPNQEDADADGVGDDCDSDDEFYDEDGDGISDFSEILQLTNPASKDTDDDQLDDNIELLIGSDPRIKNSHDVLDFDNDGNVNLSDNCLAISNSDQGDLDEDGLGNVCDVRPTVSDKFLDVNTFNRSSQNNPGFNVTSVGSGLDAGRSVARQANGKLVVVGTAVNASGNKDLAVVRYNADGSLDPSFGSGGKVFTDVSGYNDEAYAVVVQDDQKIVVAGGARRTSGAKSLALVRYNPDGSLDGDFDGPSDLQKNPMYPGNGKFVVNTDFSNSAYSVIQQADGRLVTAGFTYETSPTASYFAQVIRFDPLHGALDAGFAGGGMARYGVSSNTGAYAVIQQSDEKLALAGWSGSDTMMMRLNADGTLDSSFNGDGKLSVSFVQGADAAYSLIQQSDKKLVTVGFSTTSIDNKDIALLRVSSDGSLDDAFDGPSGFGNGKVVLPVPGDADEEGRSIVQSGQGNLLISGYSVENGKKNMFMGLLDHEGGGSGWSPYSYRRYQLSVGDDMAYDLFQQPDGKWVVGGESNGDFAILRCIIPE